MVTALVFAGGVLATSVVRTTAVGINKIKPTTTSEELILGAKVTPTPKPVDYFLAYPGVLPDHVLYPLKMIRDRVWLWLVTDPVKKSQVLLLFADKRLGAGKALIEGGKIDLGITTLTKAEKYLEQAINQALLAKEKGREIGSLLEKLNQATLKHEEVILGLQEKAGEANRSVISRILDYPRGGREQLR